MKKNTLKISLTGSIITWNEEIQSLNNLNDKDALKLFHIKTSSLPKNFEELEYLLGKT